MGIMSVDMWVFIAVVNKGEDVMTNVMVMGLVNLNILFLLVFILLVVRNLVKLYFERKQNVIGSKFRTKLVISFIALSLIPSVLLFLVASNLISNSIEKWFNSQNEEALGKSLRIAQIYYEQSYGKAMKAVQKLSCQISEKGLLGKERHNDLTAVIKTYLDMPGIEMIKIMNPLGEEIITSTGFVLQKSPSEPPIEELLKAGLKGHEHSIVRASFHGHLIDAVLPIQSSRRKDEIAGVLIFSYFDSLGLMKSVNDIKNSYEEYRRRKVFKTPLKFNYLVTFFLITLLIIFSATWFGFYLAKGITVPIQELAKATKEVAAGNLEHRVKAEADDEIGILVTSFNKMIEDLDAAHTNLRNTNLELDRRRQYIETVLNYIASGVITIKDNGIIATINPSAENILNCKTKEVVDEHFEIAFSNPEVAELKSLFARLSSTKENIYERGIQLNRDGQVQTLICSVTQLQDEKLGFIGMVVVLDDLTQLIKAQKIATWREVARRLAHEIKNPLTPIQLSAERLRKKYKDSGIENREYSNIFKECIDTILEETSDLKTIVNEFAQFARMPSPNLKPEDLPALVCQTVDRYCQIHPTVSCNIYPKTNIPLVKMDREQIKRALINLLDNAHEAMIDMKVGKQKRIDVHLSYNAVRQFATFQVCDYGIGIDSEDKKSVFVPYFSKKKGGTGLGLSIVDRIIADHNGKIFVEDNNPRGTKVTVILPIA
ncbi:MAG: sensor histidine kinase [bacterium]